MSTSTASDQLNNLIEKGNTAKLLMTEMLATQQLQTLATKPDTEDARLALRVVLNRIDAELIWRGLNYCYACKQWGEHEDGTCKK